MKIFQQVYDFLKLKQNYKYYRHSNQNCTFETRIIKNGHSVMATSVFPAVNIFCKFYLILLFTEGFDEQWHSEELNWRVRIFLALWTMTMLIMSFDKFQYLQRVFHEFIESKIDPFSIIFSYKTFKMIRFHLFFKI